MTPTRYRDQVAQLAKTNVAKAAELAEKIDDPWFQSQAWSHLSRRAEKPLPFARKAAKAAAQGRDDYQKSAVRAWEIAALGERNLHLQARRSLAEALELAASITPASSRAEALLLLFQAAFKITRNDAAQAAEILRKACSSSHWRAVRARKNAEMMLKGELLPREFFW
jgi:hypothetical protein